MAGIQLTRASARAMTWSCMRAPASSLRAWSSAAAAGLARATARPVMQVCMRSPASSVRALSSDVAAGMTGASPLEFLSEDEKMMQEAVAKFAREEVEPISAEMDRNACMSKSLIKKLFENGLMGIEVPTEYGGAGASFFSSVLAIQELSRVDIAVSAFIDVQNTLIINSFRNWASQEQKEHWFPRLATDTVGSFGLSEPTSGSDAFALATKATQDGDYYVINGSKMWITNSEYSGVFLIMANANPQEGYRGITCFIVERDTPGLIIGKPEDKLGIRASSTCPLTFENMRVHKSNILGGVGDGYKVTASTLNEGRIAIASQMVGMSQSCLEYAIRYTKERKQFGQRLYDFQAMQHQMALAATKIEAAKLMTYNTSRRLQAGLPITKEAAMAKYFASETAQEVCGKAVEWMGGVGFTKAYPVEKFYRDCKIGVIYEGTSNIQLNTIAKMLDREVQ